MTTGASRSVRDQVWGAADPKGETRQLINAVMHSASLPEWLTRFGVDVDLDWERLAALGGQFRQQVDDIAAALQVLTPRGWAIMFMPTQIVKQAVTLVESGDGDQADELLADQWDGELGGWRTSRVCQRVRGMGGGDPDLEAVFRQRARLLGLAKDHHDSGRYDASVLSLQAQMEGVVIDVTGGKKFFTGQPRQKADVVDPAHLVSIEASLAALQSAFGQGVNQTQATGGHSRHGLVHGRELTYDTRVNSAKYWSVLDSIVDWALPKARAEVERRCQEQQAANAGSQRVDAEGRRIDAREFRETRDMLRLLETSAMGWYDRASRFRDDLVGGVYGASDFQKRGLPAAHGMQQTVSADGQEVAYWRQTASGWVLGIAITREGKRWIERLYAGPDVPSGGPRLDPEAWAEPFDTPVDWQ